MQDEFSGIERLLNLPQGSTRNLTPDQAGKVLTKGVKDKADELDKDIDKVNALDTMSGAELVKCGLSLETLEEDKINIRNQLFETQRIGMAILQKYREDTKDQIDVNDRMYLAGFAGVTAMGNVLEKIGNMILKFKQEEEIKNLGLIGEEEDGRIEVSPENLMDFIEAAKEEKDEPEENVQDAEIIDDKE